MSLVLDLASGSWKLVQLLAGLGAFGAGGYLGGRALELARLRMDRRVQIIETHIPGLMKPIPETAAESVPWTAAFDAIERDALFLTWADKIVWWYVCEALPPPRHLTEMRAAAKVEDATEDKRLHTLAEEFTAIESHLSRLERFEGHLRRRVRPTFLGTLRDFASGLRVVRHAIWKHRNKWGPVIALLLVALSAAVAEDGLDSISPARAVAILCAGAGAIGAVVQRRASSEWSTSVDGRRHVKRVPLALLVLAGILVVASFAA